MPNINEINAAVYRLLTGDTELAAMCTVYKGPKRPSKAKNPAVTVDTRRLEPGEGEGIWMCDVTATVYVDVLADGAPDSVLLEDIVTRLHTALTDAEIGLDGAKALPLIAGENSGPEWQSAHDLEAYQESTFGLVFVSFI